MTVEIEKAFTATAKSTRDFMITNGQGCYIPAYQRSYSWDKANVLRLFEDAIHGLNQLTKGNNAISFLGTIIAIHDTNYTTVKPILRSEVAERVMTIIDGQQRICTFMMINIVAQNILYVKSKTIREKNEAQYTWITDQVAQLVLELEETFLLDKKTGSEQYRYYPRVIRAFEDTWSKQSESAKYNSPIAKLIWEYFNFKREKDSESKDFKYKVDDKDKKHESVRIMFDSIKKELKKICESKPSEYNFPDITNLIRSDFARNIWGFELPEEVIKYATEDTSDQNYNTFFTLFRLIILIKYMNERMAFTIVTTDGEDAAFDMFEALNTTGEPLTAFETFKPKVIEEEQLDKYENSESFKYIKDIERYLEQFKKADQRQTATSDLLIPFALSQTGDKLSKRLNDQRVYLKEIYEDAGEIQEKRNIVRDLSDIANFLRLAWLKKEQRPFLEDVDIKDEEALAGLAVLRDLGHTITIAPISRFYSSYIYASDDKKSQKLDEFIAAIKATVAFSMLWRAAKGGTSGIDNAYRQIMSTEVANTTFISKKAKNKDGNYSLGVVSIKNYKHKLNQLLQKEGYAKKADWVSDVVKVPLYSKSKKIARFLLFCASNNAIDDIDKPGLIKKGREGVSPMLNFETWQNEVYFSIEHIASQSRSGDFSRELYDEDIIDTIGNLTLLPNDENRLISNKNWKHKKLIYTLLSTKDPQEFETQKDRCKKEGLDFSKKSEEILGNAKYLGMCHSISKCEIWDSNIVNDRSERIAELSWDVLRPWLEN